MTRLALAVTLVLVATTPRLHAQADATALPPGSRVRVHQGAQSATGTLVSVDSTSLTFITGSADTVTAPRDSITGVDVSLGTKSGAGKGALIGLGVGAATGVIFGAVASTADDNSWVEFSVGQWVAGYGLLGAALGTLVGVIIGSAHHSDRWQPAVLPTVSFQAVGSEDQRVALGVRIRF